MYDLCVHRLLYDVSFRNDCPANLGFFHLHVQLGESHNLL